MKDIIKNTELTMGEVDNTCSLEDEINLIKTVNTEELESTNSLLVQDRLLTTDLGRYQNYPSVEASSPSEGRRCSACS